MWKIEPALDDADVSDATLNLLAHLPTASIHAIVGKTFLDKLDDVHFMRLAALLARKSCDEGGCPIGAVIVDEATRRIVGKGHNTLVQEAHPYNHGETSAIRDAGRIDFSRTTMYTSLSPCDVCANLIRLRGFKRVVVGDVTNASGNEGPLRDAGVQIDVLEDPLGVELYRAFRLAHPALAEEDWGGVASISRADD